MFSRMFSWSFVVAACLAGLFPAQSRGEKEAAQSGAIAVKVPASSLLMARQETGETRLDRSFSNAGLSIGGKKYATGIGTHATSMIPLPVPENPKVLRLEGACGIDDGADGDGSVEFRVMSGSEVLWSSGVMRRGMAAKKFSIPVAENGIRHLYLMADRVDNNSYDHADWVDLAWKTAGSGQGMKGAVVNASEFGMVPGVRKDQGPALRAAVSALRRQGGGVLNIPRGIYHFYPEGALNMSFHISNHDQPLIHPVCVPLADLRNVRVEGNGSLFLFHGKVVPLLVMDSENVSINRLSVDYERSWCTEARVVKTDDRFTEVEIDNAKVCGKGQPLTVETALTENALKNGTSKLTNITLTSELSCKEGIYTHADFIAVTSNKVDANLSYSSFEDIKKECSWMNGSWVK